MKYLKNIYLLLFFKAFTVNFFFIIILKTFTMLQIQTAYNMLNSQYV